MEPTTSPLDALLADPLLFIAVPLVIAAVLYVLSFWVTGRVNKNRERKRESHLASDGGADLSSLREPMHMFDRQTWAAGGVLWVFVFAVMISSAAS